MTGRPRIVIATPDRAECEVLADWLTADGYEPIRAVNLRAAADEIQSHSFDLLVADHAFAFRGGLHATSRGRTCNPHMPTVIIGESDQAARAVAARHHTMYIERPVERAAFVCMVSMVIMENRPIRRSMRKAVPGLEAMVDGVAFRVLDVSNEGLRLEAPRRHRAVLPPYFNVRVPLIGVALTIQRVWISIPSGFPRTDVASCGGALVDDSQRGSEAWRAFVDALPAGNGSGIVQIQ
jgi:CheY-like chemotaxis protein